MADTDPQDRAPEMEHDLHKLEEHIADAEQRLEARRKDANPAAEAAGDWEGEQDRGGGDDPKGAERDAAQGATGGSQDGPGATGAGGDGTAADGGGTAAEADERVTNPT